MHVVRTPAAYRSVTTFTNGLSDLSDECEGCQTHNLLCEKGTGKLHGFTTDGHFAEYSLSDYRNAMVLPDGMDMVSAAPLFCAGITGMSNLTLEENCQILTPSSVPLDQQLRAATPAVGCRYWLRRTGSSWYGTNCCYQLMLLAD